MSSQLQELSPRQPYVLNNTTCPYCGTQLAPGASDRDHVVARRFVPRGSLRDSWNLIVRTCTVCNGRKSDLEDDIAAVSLQPSACGEFADGDPDLQREAVRKGAGSFSRRTGRSVAQSEENITITQDLPSGVQLTVNLVAPPQIAVDRAYELAKLQLAGFFYWLTYHHDRHVGYWWTGHFIPASVVLRGDWGNPIYRAFMSITLAWAPRLIASIANGYFRVCIRRAPDAECWSWGLEWNKNLPV